MLLRFPILTPYVGNERKYHKKRFEAWMQISFLYETTYILNRVNRSMHV